MFLKIKLVNKLMINKRMANKDEQNVEKSCKLMMKSVLCDHNKKGGKNFCDKIIHKDRPFTFHWIFFSRILHAISNVPSYQRTNCCLSKFNIFFFCFNFLFVCITFQRFFLGLFVYRCIWTSVTVIDWTQFR